MAKTANERVLIWNNGGILNEISDENKAQAIWNLTNGKANAALARNYSNPYRIEATLYLVSDDGEPRLCYVADEDPDAYTIGWIAFVENSPGEKWIADLKENQLMLDNLDPSTTSSVPPLQPEDAVIDESEQAKM